MSDATTSLQTDRPDEKELSAIAERALTAAKKAGAPAAEVCIQHARAFTVRVLGGNIETLKQSTTHGLGLRVIVDGRVGFVSTTDFKPDALDDLGRRAVALAEFSTPDEANVLPTLAEAGGTDRGGDPLHLYDPAVLDLDPQRKIQMALALERAALAHDERIRRTDGTGASSSDGAMLIANSNGVERYEVATSVSYYVVPLADDRDGKQQMGYYSVSKRHLADLPEIEWAAVEAARRAVARIGARTIPAARVPVIMHPDVAAAWISEMHGAFSGESVLLDQSWLGDKLGETIANPAFTLVDDGRLDRGLGSGTSDGEGMPTQRNVLIDAGRCAMFLYDTYHARRAGTRSTGSAVRSYGSTPGIGHHNLYVEAGTMTPQEILAGTQRGFYMDDQGSFGFNAVTGDYSFQAQGFWIEDGEKKFAVDGVTVASNSLDMLKKIDAIGNDLVFEHSVACPTLRIAEMTVSGGG